MWCLPVGERIKTTSFRNVFRGTILKRKPGSFNRSLGINIIPKGSPDRIAVVRVKNNLHVTGLNNPEDVEEVLDFLMGTIREIQKDFQDIVDHGLYTEREMSEQSRVFVTKYMSDFDQELAFQILRAIYVNSEEKGTLYIYRETCPVDISIGNHTQKLCNFTFRLPKRINLHSFPEAFQSTNYFTVDHNQFAKSKLIVKRKVEEDRNITFSCYASGAVTMSGPNKDLMEHVYNSFIATYIKTRDLVDVDIDQMNVKIKLRNPDDQIKVYTREELDSIYKRRKDFEDQVRNGQIPLF